LNGIIKEELNENTNGTFTHGSPDHLKDTADQINDKNFNLQ